MRTYTATIGHQPDCIPGKLSIEALDDADAIRQVDAFVEDGYRNLTWANLSLQEREGAYAACNKHGLAVGNVTIY